MKTNKHRTRQHPETDRRLNPCVDNLVIPEEQNCGHVHKVTNTPLNNTSYNSTLSNSYTPDQNINKAKFYNLN